MRKQSGYRIERDSMGELRVPADALWGAQTQRAVENFPISGLPMPAEFIAALGLIKAAAATVNSDLGYLDKPRLRAIRAAAMRVAENELDSHFPIDVFQTGSGTSSNMNANEVIATLASRESGIAVHANDHVNMGQSSNDVVPSAIHVAATLAIARQLLPALKHLRSVIRKRGKALNKVVKTGRTHLMDAMPLTMAQELGGWAAQIDSAIERIGDSAKRLRQLALGGTAVGTGINADPRFAKAMAAELTRSSGERFVVAADFFAALSAQDDAVEMSGQLNALACALMKISNDLRWMNSGPLAGLGEIALPALQPGSSIMPGKVNPVIPEAVCMVCAQVFGNHASITTAGASGNFQLNVMLPLVAHNLLQSIRLLANASRQLADAAIAGFSVNQQTISAAVARNPVLVTALNPVIGYAKGAAIAKQAYAEGRPLLEVAREATELSEKELRKRLDPLALTKGGIAGAR